MTSVGPDEGEPAVRRPQTAAQGVKWSAIAVILRQLAQVASALVIARILGPASYGVVSAATIYVTLTTLMLDQGLSSALIQRPVLERRAAGAVASLNILLGVALGALTWFIAPAIADFFGVDALTDVLRILGCLLPLKALAIVPRAMLSRGLRFKSIAVADVVGAIAGAAAGIGSALLGADFFSTVYQTLFTDALVAIVLLIVFRGPLPNLAFRSMSMLLGYSVKVFATNCIAYFSRNIDNILVGRVLGVTSLAFYGMAYRVLSIPVQLIGQTVNRVLFPIFSRSAGDRRRVASQLTDATEMLATTVVPIMALISAAAPQLVFIVLGPEWMAAAALISVLAIGGARETIFYITPSLMKALGFASLNLRYELLATGMQVAGIVIGLQFGVLGVAAGYTIAGFLLIPVLLLIQRRLTGVHVRAQLGVMLPAIHASLWGAAAYLAIGLIGMPDIIHLLVGGTAFFICCVGVFLLFHRPTARRYLQRAKETIGSGNRRRPSTPGADAA
ncbi:lipopolysaccharide biosynthesis protein [Plantibacter flavus]|uniref:lipopolysaccharide biosynthesis protein n=1 Tax=Plantibacter flavus TaxID=150123 RepID=UPI003F183E15